MTKEQFDEETARLDKLSDKSIKPADNYLPTLNFTASNCENICN